MCFDACILVMFCDIAFDYVARFCRVLRPAFADGVSTAVDLYNSATGAWTTAQLSMRSGNPAATSVGNVAIFGGGKCVVVDVYWRARVAHYLCMHFGKC